MKTEFRIQYKQKDENDLYWGYVNGGFSWSNAEDAFKECDKYQRATTTVIYRVVEVTYKEAEKPKPIELWKTQYKPCDSKDWVDYSIHYHSAQEAAKAIALTRKYYAQYTRRPEFRTVHFVGTVVPE